jgi:hypothetical protein
LNSGIGSAQLTTKLKKLARTKNNEKISSEQKKEIQDEARRVGLLLKEYESLWT